MKHLRYVLLLSIVGVVIGWGGATPQTIAQTSEPPPYVMYFQPDALDPHFVIERADGTDSRKFGAGLMSRDVNSVFGPGWSPSGEWFAWGALFGDNICCGGPLQEIPMFVLHADGQRQYELPSNTRDLSIAWIDGRDVLFFAAGYENTIDIQLIDVAAGTVLGSVTLPRAEPFQRDNQLSIAASLTAYWRGDTVAVMNRYVIDRDTRQNGYDVVVMDMSGAVLRQDRFELPVGASIDVSPSGYAVIRTDEAAVQLLDLVSGDSVSIETPAPIDQVSWFPSGERGVLATTAGDTLDLQIAADISATTLISSELPAVIDRDNYFNEMGYLPPDGWLVLEDTSLLNTLTGEIVPAIVPGGVFYRWSVGGEAIFGIFQAEELLYIVYDPDTGRRTTYGEGEGMWKEVDALDIGVNEDVLVHNLYRPLVYDRDSGERLAALEIDPRTVNGWPGHEYTLMHPTEPYFIAGNGQFYAGGGNPPLVYTIHSTDGSVYHEAGHCRFFSKICASWLPARVDVSQLASGVDANALTNRARITVIQRATTPDLPLRTFYTEFDPSWSNSWNYFISWSPDGTRFLAGGTPFYESPSTAQIYDAETLQPIGELEFHYYESEVEWNADNIPVAVQRDTSLWQQDVSYTLADGQFTLYPYSLYNSGNRDPVAGPRLEDTDSGDIVLNLRGGWPTDPSVSSDGRYLAFSGVVYDLADLTVVVQLNNEGGMAFSPDGTRLLVGHGTTVEIWDFEALLASQ